MKTMLAGKTLQSVAAAVHSAAAAFFCRRTVVLPYTILAIALYPSTEAHAIPAYLAPLAHISRIYVSNTISSPNDLQKLFIVTFVVDQASSGRKRIFPLRNASTYVKRSVLYVNAISVDGAVHDLPWQVDPPPKAQPGNESWLVADTGNLMVGEHIDFAILVNVHQGDGFFVGSKDGVQANMHIDEFSGCFKVATGVAYSMQHNNGVSVEQMRNPGANYHGWCYQYQQVLSGTKYYLHYFSVSSAPSWKAVAEWYGKAFDTVEAKPSKKIDSIMASLNLDTGNMHVEGKIQRVMQWVQNNLHYSGEQSKAHVPRPFDAVVGDGFGECKDMALVVLRMLHASGVTAHLAITSTDSRWLFVQNASNMNELNHVIVYVPATGEFLDATTGTGLGLAGYQAMDVVTGKIMTISNAASTDAAGVR